MESATDHLKWSWSVDERYPKSYPINTDNVFSEIKAELIPSKVRSSSGLPAPSGPAKSAHDLIQEKTIRALYEQQYAGSYSKALREASIGNGRGFAAWKKISNCIGRAYLVDFGGVDFIPKPKVNFLHRELLAIAAILKIDDMQPEGIRELFDDLCPCGEEHNEEAIRKLIKRIKSRK